MSLKPPAQADFAPPTVVAAVKRSSGLGGSTPGGGALARSVTVPLRGEEIFGIEQDRLRARRKGLSASGARDQDDPQTVGLALSGGGIRSATFSLGVLRALGDLGLIPAVDYLSTVSGGSYIGAFLCSHYVPTEWRGDAVHEGDGVASGGTGNPFAGRVAERAFDHLRQSGRYLLPANSGDGARLLAILTRNWLAVQVVVGITLLSFFFLFRPLQVTLLLSPYLQRRDAACMRGGPPQWLCPNVWLKGLPVGATPVASGLLFVSGASLLLVLSLFWAFFLTRGNVRMSPNRIRRALSPSFWIASLAAALGLGLRNGPRWLAAGIPWPRGIGTLLMCEALLAIAAYATAEAIDYVTTLDESRGTEPTATPIVQEDRVRTRLTAWVGGVMKLAIVAGVLGLVDSAAATIYMRYSRVGASLSLVVIIGVAVPLLRQAVILLSGPRARDGIVRFARISRSVVALLAGLALFAAIATFWAVAAHALAWRGAPVGSLDAWIAQGVPQETALLSLWGIAVTLCLGTVLIGWSRAFLNLSTYSSFYSSRLRRAYLGASNVDRYERESSDVVDEDHANDDIGLERYYGAGVLAPIHLIGITINDTASSSANVVQRDRRGKPLVVSPAGFCYAAHGARDPITAVPFRGLRHGPEMPPLSTWVGISGAAASTGMGQHGSLGLSLLAGLANIRLGQWWRPGAVPGVQPQRWWRYQDSVQMRLKDEFTGRFPGSDEEQWYLTDGGHFENTGVYELVRRRVAFIVMCDNGADPDYEFADLVTLTRRMKIDFDADLTFLTEDELDKLLGPRSSHRGAFGDLPALGLRNGTDPRSGPYASLGRITYAPNGDAPDATSTLLVIKPRVCGAEAIDVVAYARTHPPFPQQTTLDQFYDEAQWESHYRLGRLIAEAVFSPSTDSERWQASQLRPLRP